MRSAELAKILRLGVLLLACSGCGELAGRGEVVSADEWEDLAPTAEARLVRSYPHDPNAFTQGLAFHDGFLYESTGRRGASTLRRVDLATGRPLKQVAIPAPYFAEGAAVLGDRVFQLTWQEETGFVYDLATLERVATFAYRGEGWGLATDGRSLILSDGTHILRFLDPATFRVERTLAVMEENREVQFLNELEWVRGEIWANVWHKHKIARIDPATGQVIGWVDLSGILPPVVDRDPEAVANGIAFDPASGRLFVTGKLWPVLHEIRLPAGMAGDGTQDVAPPPVDSPGTQ